jgi:hypothetical protein
MNGRRRFRLLRIGALALLSLSGHAVAQTRDPAPAFVATPAFSVACIACETRWPESNVAALPPASDAPGSFRERRLRVSEERRPELLKGLTFRDNQPLVNRLKRIQAVAVLTVWDSTSATLYLGVNRDGEPGLHLRQKKHDRGTLAPANRTLFSDVTPWRAIRLASQSRIP